MDNVTSPNCAIASQLKAACEVVMSAKCPIGCFNDQDMKIANELVRATLLRMIGALVQAPRAAVESMARNRNRRARRSGGGTYSVLAVRQTYLYALYWIVSARVLDSALIRIPEVFGVGKKANSSDLLFALLYQVLPEQTDVKLVNELKQAIISIRKRQEVIADAKKYHLNRGIGLLVVTLDENSDIRIVGKGINLPSTQILRGAIGFDLGQKNDVLLSIPLDTSLAVSKAIGATSGQNAKRILRTSADRNGDLAGVSLRYETAAAFAEHLVDVPAWVEGGERLVNEFKECYHKPVEGCDGKRTEIH